MKNVDPITALRSAQQWAHGQRVEARQRVNGQPNGYKPVSEYELQSSRTTLDSSGDMHSEDVMDQHDNISLHDLRQQERRREMRNRIY
ncbi:hypothetical protein ACWX0O_01840 [Nitrobacteraceae bacterium UC4449_H16]